MSDAASGARQGWAPEIRARLSALRLSPTREIEIVEELSQHLTELHDELRRGGASDEDARRRALAELLGPEALAAYMRPLRQARATQPVQPGAPRGSWLSDMWQDVRYALGTLRRQPGFALGAILTLALGIGANSAIFALVDATLLRPLPVPAPDRLVAVTERNAASSRARLSPNAILDFRERSHTLDVLGGYIPNIGGMVMAGKDGNAETVSRQWATSGFFDAIGVPPVAGRYFQVDDDRARREAVVLAESFWRSRFDGDPSVIGRELRLDGENYTVLGVAPDRVQLLGKTNLWAMIQIEGAPPRARTARMFHVAGRMKPGIALSAANADLSTIAAALAQEFPATNEGRGVAVDGMDSFIIGADLRQTSMLFIGVVLIVLLICCANVANLLLARASARARELALRTAIGADRPRLIRQLLTESLVLAALGGIAGFALGAAILQWAPTIVPEGLLPPAVELTVDLRLVLFCAGAALFVGVLFGLAPAWRATSVPSAQALSVDGRTVIGGGGTLRNLLVASEVATAVLLLVGAGLLLRTLLAVQNVDRGYKAESILTMVVDPLGSQYPTQEKLLQFYDAVADEVRALPDVGAVAWASTLPLGPSYAGRAYTAVVGDPPVEANRRPAVDYQLVNATYFETLDLPIVEGRAFDVRDSKDGVQTCIVNEGFVRAHLAGRSPVGMRITVQNDETKPPVERLIVGVARQVKGRPDELEDFQQVYVPMTQAAMDDTFLVVRPKTGRAGLLAPSVRAAIGRIDKEQLVSIRDVLTLEDIAWEATARHRFRAVLVTAFAGLALVLAMVGLFGILAYSVQRRIRDLGVRRALGATTGDVVRVVVGGALPVIAAGAVVGGVLAVGLVRLLESMLFGVAPLDPLTFLVVAGVLSLTALLAIAGPAWKATRVDPVVALRSE